MEYDALNRLIERTLYAVTYDKRHEGIAAILLTPQTENPDYPRYGVNAQGKYVIAQDVATFGYDVAGNMILADNGSARVRRGYYPGGLLRRDSLYIRAVGNCPSGSDPFACHEYILELTYDLNGRRIKLKHPAQLISGSGAPRDYVAYTYDAQTGALKTVTDVLNNQFGYHQNLRNELDSLYLPGSGGAKWREGYGYDLAGNRLTHKVWNTSMVLKRETTHIFDARGKILTTRNTTGAVDSMTVTYSGLGHVLTNRLSARGKTYGGFDVRTSSTDTLTLDALGNLRKHVTRTERKYNNQTDSSISHRTNYYEPRTGRLALSNAQGGVQVDTTHYDSAGNIVFTTTKLLQQAVLTDRASYYASDGSLHAADFRTASQSDVKFKTMFEEYRYDALGRRVLVRTRRYCHPGYGQYMVDECNLSTVRRTVWDGSQELWEIQMPGRNQMHVDTMENDVAPVKLARTSNGWDLNTYFGRVTYTHGPGIDQPLGVVRLGYADWPSQKSWDDWAPFAFVPLWNSRGQPDTAYFPVGGSKHCNAGDTLRCVFIDLPALWTVYGSYAPPVTPIAWQGTLLENKTDKTGTLYRRHRVYDPVTGRFTQEDPIGFAGGMNLYGFAGGDPVNFSDPFGLCPPEDQNFGPECFGAGGGFGGGGSGVSWGDRITGSAAGSGDSRDFVNSVVALALTDVQEASASGASSSPKAGVPPTINFNQQRSHVYGSKAYVNRVKQGKPTSAFYDLPSALQYTNEAWHKGTPVPGRPNVRDYEFGHPVGVGPNGGTQSKVRVHRNSENQIHGHPAGPVTP